MEEEDEEQREVRLERRGSAKTNASRPRLQRLQTLQERCDSPELRREPDCDTELLAELLVELRNELRAEAQLLELLRRGAEGGSSRDPGEDRGLSPVDRQSSSRVMVAGESWSEWGDVVR